MSAAASRSEALPPGRGVVWSGPEEFELTILMPCLNEAETIATCIRKALGYLARSGVRGEILIADNGSSDGSQAIAEELGARVVAVAERGYGSALRAGILAARGRYVVMGDADDSYDFASLDPFLAELRAGAELVMGNRLKGRIEPDAMPWLHRWLGNPVLSFLGRLFFHAGVGDFHCGLRGFTREAALRMDLRTTGMEFASEMVIRGSLLRLRTAEVPITLYRDGRSRPPHLRTWRDGWRHLRFMLLFAPRWLFLVPGLSSLCIGGVALVWLVGGSRRVGSLVFDIHTLLVAGSLCLIGFQLCTFAAFTEVFAITEGFRPMPAWLDRILRHVRLELGLTCGALLAMAGAIGLVLALLGWSRADFGPLDPATTMRVTIPAVVLLTLGVQVIYSSFFLSILGLRRR